MSDFQTRFNATLEQNITELNSREKELNALIPGLHPAHIRRLLNNISSLLGKVDRGQAAHPEFLAGNPKTVPERAVELAAGVSTSLAAGPESFLQTTLTALVEIERHLISAVGVGEYKIQAIKNAQVRALNQIVDRAENSQKWISATSNKLSEHLRSAGELSATVSESAKTAATDTAKIAEIRKQAEKLAKGNPSQNPLEAVVRTAREKLTFIEDTLATATGAANSAGASAGIASEKETEVQKVLERLSTTDEKARSILSTATQAGLAGAYKLERENLAKQQKLFAWGFYVIIALIILYAAIFIIPLINKVFEQNTQSTVTATESAFMLAVRIVVITPAFWALVFTSRRFTNLETLQMDYAAKATTALAYFGYKDEMDQDASLSAKLKDGLIARFIEHPSRLLGDKVESAASIVGPEGTKVVSESHSPGVEAAIKVSTGE